MNRAYSSACYTISAVSDMTGVKPATLRAWERRYGLVRPRRSEGGQRLYTAADVQRIRRILACLDQGVMLGQIEAQLETGTESATAALTFEWRRLQEEIIEAVAGFDERAIDTVYARALAACPFPEVTESLTVPVLSQLGQRWESGEGLVVEEHFFRMYVRNALGARFFHRQRAEHGPVLVAACMPGEAHDLGLLLFCLAAEAEGFRTINLGPDTPLDELAQVVAGCGARAIVLAASYCDVSADSARKLQMLIAAEAGPVVLVGGKRVEAARETLEHAGAFVLGADIREGIRRLWEMLG